MRRVAIVCRPDPYLTAAQRRKASHLGEDASGASDVPWDWLHSPNLVVALFPSLPGSINQERPSREWRGSELHST